VYATETDVAQKETTVRHNCDMYNQSVQGGPENRDRFLS